MRQFIILTTLKSLYVTVQPGPSTEALQRRDALVPDDQTREEMRRAIERASFTAMGIVKMKKKTSPSSRKLRERMRLESQSIWPSEASQPCSPTHQILKISAQRKRRDMSREVSKEDWERYERSIKYSRTLLLKIIFTINTIFGLLI